MPLEKLVSLTDKVADLLDKPNATMTADELKAWFDKAPDEVRVYLNKVIDQLQSVTDGDSGADNVKLTTIPDLTGDNVQAVLESLRNKLKSITDGSSGADFVQATGITGLNGATVQALLESLKSFVDTYNTNHKSATSTDHDNRYYTKTENDNKYETKDNLTNTRKLSTTGDFTGSWFGIKNPTYADPGIANVVEQHTAELAQKTTQYVTLEEYAGSTTPDYWDDVLQTMITEFNELNTNVAYTVVLKPIEYKFQNTISIDQIYGLRFLGSNPIKTIFRFVNTTADKPFIDMTYDSGETVFENMQFIDDTAGTSIALRLDEYSGKSAKANWHNRFVFCRINNFKVGAKFTTMFPLDGTTHRFLDNTIFDHCKFKNNRTTFLMQNKQAVNINLISTDIENTDTDETYTFIRDEAGSQMNIFGGSWIGKGKLIEFYKDDTGTNLHSATKYSFHGTRFEFWTTQVGTLIETLKDAGATYAGTFSAQVDFDKCQFHCDAQTLRLNKTIKTNIIIKDTNVYNGTIRIYDTPTQEITATTSGGTTSRITVRDSYGFSFDEETTSSFGTYNRRFTSSVEIKNNSVNATNTVMSSDSKGFYVPNSSIISYNQLGFGLNQVENKLIYNDNDTNNGFKDIKLVVPKYARPCKIIMYKQPVYNPDVIYDVYLVKDSANWTDPNNFDYTTDTLLITTINTTGKVGYFESLVNITTQNVMGTYLQAGKQGGSPTWKWLEGRLYFRHYNTTANFVGFVGVEFM